MFSQKILKHFGNLAWGPCPEPPSSSLSKRRSFSGGGIEMWCRNRFWRWGGDDRPLPCARGGQLTLQAGTKYMCVTLINAATWIFLIFCHFSFLFSRIVSLLVTWTCNHHHCLAARQEPEGGWGAWEGWDTRGRGHQERAPTCDPWVADGCHCHRSVPASALFFHSWTSVFCDFLGVDAASNLLKTSAIRSTSKKDAISVRSVPLAFLGWTVYGVLHNNKKIRGKSYHH